MADPEDATTPLDKARRVAAELTREVAGMMAASRPFQQSSQFTQARAARGWAAEAEPHLLTLVGRADAGSPLALVVADVRAAVHRLAEFIPDLEDDDSGEPQGIYEDDDGEQVVEWPHRATEASRTRYLLIRADNRGRFARLEQAVGQPGRFVTITLDYYSSEVLKKLQASGRPLRDKELTQFVGGKASTARHAVGVLKRYGLALPPERRKAGYRLTENGRVARHLGEDVWATVGPHTAGL